MEKLILKNLDMEQVKVYRANADGEEPSETRPTSINGSNI